MKIAILGFGTVGRGVYEILQRKETNDTAQLEAAHIFIRKGKEKTLSVMTDDLDVILEDPECRCVVEVMGGIEPAHVYLKGPAQGQACRHRQQGGRRRSSGGISGNGTAAPGTVSL